jgi:transcriptional regulator with XRE-family HTH domain
VLENETVAAEDLKEAAEPTTYRQRFREARELTGYSAQALAHAIGISAQAMHQFEHNKQALTIDKFVAACAVLNANVRWVLNGWGSKFEHGQPASAPKGGRTSKAGRKATPTT